MRDFDGVAFVCSAIRNIGASNGFTPCEDTDRRDLFGRFIRGKRRRVLLCGSPPGAVVVEDIVIGGATDVAALVVGASLVRMSLDGFGCRRRSVTLSMSMSGRLRSMGMRSGSRSRSMGMRSGSSSWSMGIRLRSRSMCIRRGVRTVGRLLVLRIALLTISVAHRCTVAVGGLVGTV